MTTKPTNGGTRQGACFGLSYEEGVKIALEWVLENTKELPIRIVKPNISVIANELLKRQ